MTKIYTGPQTSKKTSSYFDSATIHFQNTTKAAADFTMYATLVTEHAINVIENGASAICSIQAKLTLCCLKMA